MPQTSVYKLRYPNLSDSPNVPSDMKNLADDAERSLVQLSGTIQSSGSAGGAVTPASVYWRQYLSGSSPMFQMFAWRTGRIASVQGLVQRATKDYTIADQATALPNNIHVANLPVGWEPEHSQVGITMGGFQYWITVAGKSAWVWVHKPVRWSISAGKREIRIAPADDLAVHSTPVGTFSAHHGYGINNTIKVGDWVSLQFTYNTKAVTAAPADVPSPEDPDLPDAP